MGAGLRFELLGPLRAWYGDRELDLGPGKQRAVLAILLLYAGRPVSPTQIVDAVWQDDPPMNGANVVQKYVAGLRRILEPERSPRSPGQLLTLTDTGYQLRVSAENLDTELFERRVRRASVARNEGCLSEAAEELRMALALWRGEPLVGLNGMFFESARTRLIEGRATALESWAETELNLGRHKEMVTDLMQAVGRFPVREQLHGLLMLALYRSGRQAEALAAFREVRALLNEEYGVEPGDSLQELHRRILRSDPALGATGEPDRFVPPILVAPAAEPVVAPAVAVPVVAPAVAVPVVAPAVAVPVVAPAAAVSVAPQAVGLPDPIAAPVPVVAGPVASLPSSLPPPPSFAPVGLPAPARKARRPWGVWIETAVAVALALASFGLLTWAVVLHYAVQRRNVRLGVAAAGYVALTGFFVTWVVLVEVKPEPDTVDFFAVLILGVIWFGGALHVLLMHLWLGRSVDGRPSEAVAAQRVRREQARHLLYHYPSARSELHIGRPDLVRTFDDGGLIDVNLVADEVLWRLPGVTPEQGQQIATERSLGGGFTSLDEFAIRCRLSPALVDSMREVLVFLPPPQPPPRV